MGKKIRKVSVSGTASRHLRWESFEARIHKGIPSVEPLEGRPPIVLFVDAGGKRIGLRLAGKHVDIPSRPLAEIAIHPVGAGIAQMLEVSTANPALFRDFYAFCCTVADRIQINHDPAGKALRTTLASWSALLKPKALLSRTDQTGLYAELIFLRRTAAKLGWTSAAQAWQGPLSEEHDFTLPLVDVEVK